MRHGGVPDTPPRSVVQVPGPALVLLLGVGAGAAAQRAFQPDEVADAEKDPPDSLADRLERGQVLAVPLEVPGADAVRRLVAVAVERDRPVDAIVLSGVPPLSERFRTVTAVVDPEALVIDRAPASWDHRAGSGPFDLIGDVHGCLPELLLLLARLGYRCRLETAGRPIGAQHPDGRTAVFVGDLVDRGPDVPGTLRLVIGMVQEGTALAVCGNHDDALRRALVGDEVTPGGGQAVSLSQLGRESPAFRTRVLRFLAELPAHLLLDRGRLVVAHAGLAERFHGRESDRVRALCLTGTPGADSLPTRPSWADEYRGDALVVHGHTPTAVPAWRDRTICIDGGCVFGGALAAVRYPERDIATVPALATYSPAVRPFLPVR